MLNSDRKWWLCALAALLIVLSALGVLFRAEIARLVSSFAVFMRYEFVRHALITGLAVSLCSAILGVTLVLKRYSMIGDGLSHAGFGALAIAMALSAVPKSSAIYGVSRLITQNPTAFTTAVVMLMAFLLLRLNSSARIKGDAAIAIISAGALATGVMVISTVPGMNIDIGNYMFGSILSVSKNDMIYSICAAAVVISLYALFYRKLFAVTFDEVFARATLARAGAYNMIIAMLTAVTVVMGMRLMGTMLISSLLIFPALSAMCVFSKFIRVVICAAIISAVCFIIGLMLSCAYDLPAGAAVVCSNIAAFAIFWLIGKSRGC